MKKIFSILLTAFCVVTGCWAQSSSSRYDEKLYIYMGDKIVEYTVADVDSIGFFVPMHINSLFFEEATVNVSGAEGTWIPYTLKLRWTPIGAVPPSLADTYVASDNTSVLRISNQTYNADHVLIDIEALAGTSSRIVAQFDGMEAICNVTASKELTDIFFTEESVAWEGSSSSPIVKDVYLEWSPADALPPILEELNVWSNDLAVVVSEPVLDAANNRVVVQVTIEAGMSTTLYASYGTHTTSCAIATSVAAVDVTGISFVESRYEWESADGSVVTSWIALQFAPADAYFDATKLSVSSNSSYVALTGNTTISANIILLEVMAAPGYSADITATYGDLPSASCTVSAYVPVPAISSIQFTESQYTFEQAYSEFYVYLSWSPSNAETPTAADFNFVSSDGTVVVENWTVSENDGHVAVKIYTSDGGDPNLRRDPAATITATYLPNNTITASCDVVFTEPTITGLIFSPNQTAFEYYAAPGTTVTEELAIWWNPDFPAHNKDFFEAFSITSDSEQVRIEGISYSSWGVRVTIAAEAGSSATITASYGDLTPITCTWRVIETTQPITAMAFENPTYDFEWESSTTSRSIYLDWEPADAIPPTAEDLVITSSSEDVVVRYWDIDNSRVRVLISGNVGNASATLTATYQGTEMASCVVNFLPPTVISQFYFEQDSYEWTSADGNPVYQYINLYWTASEALASGNFEVSVSDESYMVASLTHLSSNSAELYVGIIPGNMGMITVTYKNNDNGTVLATATCEVSAVMATNAVTSFDFKENPYEVDYVGRDYTHYVYLTWGAADAIPPTQEEITVTSSDEEAVRVGGWTVYPEERLVRVAIYPTSIEATATLTATYKNWEKSCAVSFKQAEPTEIRFDRTTETTYAAANTTVTTYVDLYWYKDGEGIANSLGETWKDRFNIYSSNTDVKITEQYTYERYMYLALEGPAGATTTLTAEYGDLAPATFTWTIEETTQEITALQPIQELLDYSGSYYSGERLYWTYLYWSPADAMMPTESDLQFECSDPSVRFSYWYINSSSKYIEPNFYAPTNIEADITVKYTTSAGEVLSVTIPFKSCKPAPVVEAVADACVINIYFAQEPCYDVVFAGSYADMDGNVVNDAASYVKMQPLEGQPGWYTVTLKPTLQEDGTTMMIKGKAVQLDAAGNFNENYQWGNWSTGHVSDNYYITYDNGVPYLEIYNVGEVMYVQSSAWANSPCTLGTFNLTTTVPVTAGGTVYVAGDCFEQEWAIDAYPMTRVDNYNWTVSLPVTLGKEYKYLVNSNWDNDMLGTPEIGYDCGPVLGNLTLNGTEVHDAVYGFANFGATNCANATYPEYTTGTLLTENSGLLEGDTTNYVSVRGKVTDVANVDLSAGKACFTITDEYNQDLYCYYIANVQDTKFVHADQLAVGDEVVVFARLYNYRGTMELIAGWLTETTNTFDASNVPAPQVVTVADALSVISKLATNEITKEQYQISGVVSQIVRSYSEATTARFYITDDSGASTALYCYNINYLNNQGWTANDWQLEVGDKVTIVGQLQNYSTTPEVVQGYLLEHARTGVLHVNDGQLVTDQRWYVDYHWTYDVSGNRYLHLHNPYVQAPEGGVLSADANGVYNASPLYANRIDEQDYDWTIAVNTSNQAMLYTAELGILNGTDKPFVSMIDTLLGGSDYGAGTYVENIGVDLQRSAALVMDGGNSLYYSGITFYLSLDAYLTQVTTPPVTNNVKEDYVGTYTLYCRTINEVSETYSVSIALDNSGTADYIIQGLPTFEYAYASFDATYNILRLYQQSGSDIVQDGVTYSTELKIFDSKLYFSDSDLLLARNEDGTITLAITSELEAYNVGFVTQLVDASGNTNQLTPYYFDSLVPSTAAAARIAPKKAPVAMGKSSGNGLLKERGSLSAIKK